MSITLLFGLLLQLVALVIVLGLVGTRLPMFNGALLVVMLCIFHGLTELANILFPGLTTNLMLVDQESVDQWVVLVGMAILFFSIAYVWTMKHYKVTRVKAASEAHPQVKLLLLFAIAIPSLVMGLRMGQANYRTYGYWLGGLSQAVFLLATVMCFVCMILRCRKSWTPFLLVGETLPFILLGSRLSVIAVFVMTAGGLARYGRPLKVKHLVFGFVLLGGVSALVSSTRVYYGREMYATASIRERLSNIGRTATTAVDDSNLDLKNDFVYRIDGNIFPAMVYGRFREGYSGVGLKSFATNFHAIVPNFFYSTKLESAVEDRDERAYLDAHFGLPTEVDLATTLFTVLFGYCGSIGLLCSAVGLGAGFAYLDRWVNASTSPAAFCFGLSAAYCCIFVEQGVQVYFVTLRSVIVLLVLIWVTSRVRLGERAPKHTGRRGPLLFKAAASVRNLR